MPSFETIFGFRNKLITGVIIVLLIFAIPYWPIVNRAYIYNKLSPYHDLNGKIAVDDLDLQDYGFSGPKNQIYIVDTLNHTYRQITANNSYKKDPYASQVENKVYFKSTKLPSKDREADGSYYSYVYNLETQNVEGIDRNILDE